jgi:hypothetical protein
MVVLLFIIHFEAWVADNNWILSSYLPDRAVMTRCLVPVLRSQKFFNHGKG